ncbi:MAG TPA: homogentisate phytyltransferase [Thermosynechococcaceae cyanobacterium]
MSRFPQVSDSSPKDASKAKSLFATHLYAFWKFSRPHTIIGTSLSVLGLYFVALALHRTAIPDPVAVLLALVTCLSGNVYIVGLNQLEDVAIDRINKPHLPIASGEFSRLQSQVIVVTTGILAIGLAAVQGKFLLGTVGLSLLIGTVYSLPPIRLKRFPVWASLCIFTVRGVIVNLGLFLHFQGGGPVPPAVWALTLFVLGFTFAIAIFKDIPDMEGDRQYYITTFTLKLGQHKVFNLALFVIAVCYLGLGLAGLTGLLEVNGPFLAGSHLVALGLLVWGTRRVNLQDKRSISRCYQFIWKLFFLEYLLFPIACWLN